ncbi:DUF3530 family protein [Colwellia sp. MEBiC06753]
MKIFCQTLLLLLLLSPVSSIYAQQSTEDKTAPETVETPKPEQTKPAPATDESPSESGNSQTPAKVNIAPPVSLISQYQQDIERAVSPELLKPMLAGTEDFLTIVQADNHSSDKGTAILLPEWSQAATDAKAINFLRQYLPDQGWTTIVIQPQQKPMAYPSHAEKAVLAIEENQKTLADYQAKLTPILSAVMEKAAENPGIFLVIAQGNNAAILLDLYQSNEQLEKPNALITLSAHLLTEAENKELAKKMATSSLPILDLVLAKDTPWVDHFASLRVKLAKQELKPFYRQRQLMNFRSGYYPEPALAKEIKGWLATIGW